MSQCLSRQSLSSQYLSSQYLSSQYLSSQCNANLSANNQLTVVAPRAVISLGAIRPVRSMKAKQLGFSLVESTIALAIGVFLLAGIMLSFSSMRGTTSQTLAIGELQQNGRLALDILRRDLAHAGFWGQYQAPLDDGLLATPNAPAGDCRLAGQNPNSGSFPIDSPWPFWRCAGR